MIEGPLDRDLAELVELLVSLRILSEALAPRHDEFHRADADSTSMQSPYLLVVVPPAVPRRPAWWSGLTSPS